MRLQDSDKRGLDILSDWVYENGTPSKELQDFMERLVYLLKVATITEKHVKRHLLRMDENDLLTIEVQELMDNKCLSYIKKEKVKDEY